MVAGQRRMTSSTDISCAMRMTACPSVVVPLAPGVSPGDPSLGASHRASLFQRNKFNQTPSRRIFAEKFDAAQRTVPRMRAHSARGTQISHRRAATMISRRTALMGAAAGALLLATPALAVELNLPREKISLVA